jgi:hypothetical protein
LTLVIVTLIVLIVRVLIIGVIVMTALRMARHDGLTSVGKLEGQSQCDIRRVRRPVTG